MIRRPTFNGWLHIELFYHRPRGEANVTMDTKCLKDVFS